MNKNHNLFVWGAMISVLAYLVYHFSPHQIPRSEILSDNNTQVTVEADPRGHFVFAGEINGKPVVFFYDPGATTISIPEKIAREIGLEKGEESYSHTANGKAIGYATSLRRVKVGAIEMSNIEGRIAPGLKGNEILLGLSFLNKVESTQFQGTLKLTVRK